MGTRVLVENAVVLVLGSEPPFQFGLVIQDPDVLAVTGRAVYVEPAPVVAEVAQAQLELLSESGRQG